jgi:porin
MPSPSWTVTTTLMNLEDASTTSGFSDIGDGTTWATNVDYLGSVNDLPGGGSFAIYYGFDADFARIGGLNFDPGTGEILIDSKSSAWTVSWNGWQYLYAEGEDRIVDPRNSRQDLEGLGVFLQLGVADQDTNPTSWAIAGGLSGRGSIPGRDDDTWGVGLFCNDLLDPDLELLEFENSTSGLEVYYDIALLASASLTLDAQWTKSAFESVEDATILGARLNISF